MCSSLAKRIRECFKMTVTRVARGNKRTRRGRRKIKKQVLPVDRLFDSPPPELNDGGVCEGTATGVEVKYAQDDDDSGIRGNEGSARVEYNSGHDTMSA
jgi:hypothetical protein